MGNAQVFARTKRREDIVGALLGYLPPPRCFAEGWLENHKCAVDGDADSTASSSRAPASRAVQAESAHVLKGKIAIAQDMMEQVQDIRAACEQSSFVMSTEFVGSSMLFVADADPPKARVAVIDFAKSFPVPEGITLDHRSQWTLGNHEDGFLHGLEEIICCWQDVIDLLSDELKTLSAEGREINNSVPSMSKATRQWWCCA